jgi:hypothetical protein
MPRHVGTIKGPCLLNMAGWLKSARAAELTGKALVACFERALDDTSDSPRLDAITRL